MFTYFAHNQLIIALPMANIKFFAILNRFFRILQLIQWAQTYRPTLLEIYQLPNRVAINRKYLPLLWILYDYLTQLSYQCAYLKLLQIDLTQYLSGLVIVKVFPGIIQCISESNRELCHVISRIFNIYINQEFLELLLNLRVIVHIQSNLVKCHQIVFLFLSA